MTDRGFRVGSAFSLIEVLIAVLVLSLGLLGLGAVFPTVLRQQRVATESTLGLSARHAAMPILASNENFRPGGRGWLAIRRYVEDQDADPGDWVAIEPESFSENVDHLGSYILEPAPSPWDNDPAEVQLPLSQRLFPLPYSTGEPPRFVWDIAARLTGDPSSPDYPYDSPLLVAVFIRPIDSGIRPDVNPASPTQERYSLVASLLDNGIDRKHRRVPAAVDRTGAPTFNGLSARGSRYATPIIARVEGPGTDPDAAGELLVTEVLSQDTDLPVARHALAAGGQRFIDRGGRVHVVTGTRGQRIGQFRIESVEFTPPVSPEDVDGDGDFDQDDVNPVVFLPHTTLVDPYVFTVNP